MNVDTLDTDIANSPIMSYIATGVMYVHSIIILS